MFATTLFLVVSAGATHWGLPHAGKALNQSELTYFRDMAIIEVSEPKMLTDPRKASTATGTNAIEVVVQSARVLDANFESAPDVRLVFGDEISAEWVPASSLIGSRAMLGSKSCW